MYLLEWQGGFRGGGWFPWNPPFLASYTYMYMYSTDHKQLNIHLRAFAKVLRARGIVLMSTQTLLASAG